MMLNAAEFVVTDVVIDRIVLIPALACLFELLMHRHVHTLELPEATTLLLQVVHGSALTIPRSR
jgi:hypothetical protein